MPVSYPSRLSSCSTLACRPRFLAHADGHGHLPRSTSAAAADEAKLRPSAAAALHQQAAARYAVRVHGGGEDDDGAEREGRRRAGGVPGGERHVAGERVVVGPRGARGGRGRHAPVRGRRPHHVRHGGHMYVRPPMPSRSGLGSIGSL